MIAQLSNNRLTPEEYLDFEEKSDIKHEYIDGEVYAMSGSTDSHNTVALNVASALKAHLKGSNCDVYMSDIKVQLKAGNYYYPDVIVTCHPDDKETPLAKRFPKLIIEVLSPSTEAFDRGDKFADYQNCESLEEYILISPKRRRVEVFRRVESGLWTLQMYQEESANFESLVVFKSVALQLSLSDIYEGVRLDTGVIESAKDKPKIV